MAPTNKQQNVVNMIKTFVELSKEIPDGKLKDEFKSFIYRLTLGNMSLPKMLDWIEGKIQDASTIKHQDLQTNAKATKKFWENIQDMIINTYKENKEL